ncbi:GNAT family N-acetyltransferase [Olsenella sp. An290]|uniref:GNAT family N-acetyltransferase n=1 Tax=Olsenella sp. An290 TaxID=1965625 RepID=UPI000B38AE05|nr:GNAT family N-acetyltransferase [Olsenella sp. An290]OUO35318.1 hypothetical protein B5F84_03490 [Olsenella sp. An290]
MDLTIRRMAEKDLGPLTELLSDARAMRRLESPFSPERSRAFLEEVGLADLPLVYAVEDARSFVGCVIYHDYDDTSVEIGWVLVPQVWGRGYATELTRVLLGWARSAGKDAIIECVPEHKATRRIAERFDFELAGRRDGLLVFRRSWTKPVQAALRAGTYE